ncbi:MAG: cardiolipin synthase [Deltaproteobacteria bacterium]|nr:cardiolipin synthase [Deltaproteobacteria bacterium]MBU51648.1 cardiolipin synthase [Deltaproteobacteria bacterium]|tara:strand:+ start:4002 stop:5447 length:1446 start_codon:yes stop_codon:yes gene_type:complete
MWKLLAESSLWIAAIVGFIISIGSAIHVILYKRDVRAAFGWAGFCMAVPYVGPFLYLCFGINRVQRKAIKLRRSRVRLQAPLEISNATEDLPSFSDISTTLDSLSLLVDGLVERPLLSGNKFTLLTNGDEAYPEICKAIREAKHSVTLLTYIFDNDQAGKMFVDALKEAHDRGVQVRVLIDDMGRRYSWVPIDRVLREAGIPTDLFMKTEIPWSMQFVNLRNHRKIIVIDGKVGYTGGLNIRDGHMHSLNPKHKIQDIHFRVEGPVVTHLQEAFAEDWVYTTGELLEGEPWFVPLQHEGKTLARGIPDGPDGDFESIRWTILGALSCARSSIRIITPYFLPDQTLITSLNLAAMRGVDVEILLPERGNLPTVQWASTATLHQVMERGCKVYYTPPPFDHSKLMVVDKTWVLLGSANWDPRSLRLNFEFNVECYDAELGKDVHERLGAIKQQSKLVTPDHLSNRSFPAKVRDGFARLFSPYM